MPDYFQLSATERKQYITKIVSSFPVEEAAQKKNILTSLVDCYEGYDKRILDLFAAAIPKRMVALR